MPETYKNAKHSLTQITIKSLSISKTYKEQKFSKFSKNIFILLIINLLYFLTLQKVIQNKNCFVIQEIHIIFANE